MPAAGTGGIGGNLFSSAIGAIGVVLLVFLAGSATAKAIGGSSRRTRSGEGVTIMADAKVATVYDGGPEGEEREVTSFLNSDEKEVGYRTWKPTKGCSKGLVVIMHGLHEHGGRWAHVAHWLVGKGYNVCASDHQGHGRSYNPQGLISSWEEMVSDQTTFLKRMMGEHKKENPSLPTFVICHSMGTLVSTAALEQLQQDATTEAGGKAEGEGQTAGPFSVAKVVFSGCPLKAGPGAATPLGVSFLYNINKFPRLLKGMARVFAKLDPNGPNAPIHEDALSSNPAVLEKVHRDSLHFTGSIKNKTGFEVIKLIEQVKRAAPSLTMPSLLIHGEADTIAYPEGSMTLLGLLGAADKMAKVLPGLKHECLNEDGWEDIMTEVDDFFSR